MVFFSGGGDKRCFVSSLSTCTHAVILSIYLCFLGCLGLGSANVFMEQTIGSTFFLYDV